MAVANISASFRHSSVGYPVFHIDYQMSVFRVKKKKSVFKSLSLSLFTSFKFNTKMFHVAHSLSLVILWTLNIAVNLSRAHCTTEIIYNKKTTISHGESPWY
jgi:hypothetical protein